MPPVPTIRRIGVLTSGGDCAGLNAAIRAVVHRAVDGYGWEVTGIREGTRGLLDRPLRVEPLTLKLFTGNVLRLGGTILGTVNKGDPLAFPLPGGGLRDRSADFVEGFRLAGLDALVGIGGDGSMRILSTLTARGGIPFVGIPKTIDNDVALTDVAIGFSTAVSTAVEALDRLQPTAASHRRVMILEVMGRDAGHIALHAGIAGGADVILIPEIPYDIAKVAGHIHGICDGGRQHALVIVSEAVRIAGGAQVFQKAAEGGMARYGGVGHQLGEAVAERTGAETRVTVLGHVQRGGIPNSQDRIVASAFGVHAVDLIAQGRTGRMVAWRDREVVDVPLADVVAAKNPVDTAGTLMRTARGLGICFGD